MKKIFTLVLGSMMTLFSAAQCDPLAYDFGGALYGVYPDTTVGLADGVVNQPYNQVMYFMIPSDAGLIDPNYSGQTISNVVLQSITYNNGLPISNLGLSHACNPANCTFSPSEQKCAVLTGTPNQIGVFNIEINVVATALVFGFPVPVDYSFAGYTLTVTDGSVAVMENASMKFELSNARPNPASVGFNMNFESPTAEMVKVEVHNLLGGLVYNKSFVAKRGFNTLWMDTQDWEEGVYLYSVQNGSSRSTKRIVVQH
jgi:hypothetical protein